MAQEPRWKKIAALTAQAIERELALVQAKVMQTEVAVKQVSEMVIEQQVESGEGKMEFEQRLLKLEQQKKGLPLQLGAHLASLEALAEKYVEHLNGNSFISQKSGALEDIDAILGEG